jgi:DNA helicase-2/ATP-dependent DNA helicase PcrA
MNDTIARILAPLNDEQMAVANCQGNCLVIAGPGSGKTNTISRKIAASLQDRSERIAAVTFTREAALELRARTIALAGKQAASRLLVGTFHSVMNLMSFPDLATDNGREMVFGREIIAGRPWPFGKTKWKIVKEGLRRSFILRAMSELAIDDISLEDASRIIEHVKSGRPATELRHEQMTQIYTDIMNRQKVIDFQDILLKTNAGLESGAVPPLNVTRLFIDEYQDTDKPQFDMAAAHHRANVILTGVGDDDQSIYGFRNALGYEGMLMFERSFNAERLMLGNNYRSHAEIVGAATKVINHNLDRVDKTLVAMKGQGGKTAWKTFRTREEEAHAAALYAGEALRVGGDQPCAIFARNNRRLDEVEARLQALNIPYRRPPGESILNSVEVMIFCAAIQAVVKPEKKVIDQLLSWCRVDEQSIVKLEKLFRGAFILGQSEDFARAKIEDSVKEKWREFVKLFTGWQSSLAAGADTLLVYGISDWLSSYAPDKRSENVLQIARDMFMPRRADPERGIMAQTVQDRLTAIKMAQSKREEKKAEGEEAPKVVELMTAHGSKGLEFDYVWVVGAEDEVFPSKDGTLEEERRLMFVAMTRARKELMLSTGGGKPPSMFLKESGIERIVDPEDADANLVDA